jgi:hypothetical protein
MDDDNTKQIVRKTYFPPSTPVTATMSPQDSEGWNSWATGLIAERTAEVAAALGDECGKIEARLLGKITALEKQITDLRIADAYARGKEAGSIIDLPSTPKSWRRDVA